MVLVAILDEAIFELQISLVEKSERTLSLSPSRDLEMYNHGAACHGNSWTATTYFSSVPAICSQLDLR